MIRRALWKYWEGTKKATELRGVDYGEEKMLWDFRHEATVQGWACTSDKEYGGYSRAVFMPNKEGFSFNYNKPLEYYSK